MPALVEGSRTSLVGPLTVVLFSTVTGIAVGLFTAWRGGWVDTVIGRLIDVLFAFPALSFLGLGVQPPTPDWGAMINQSQAAALQGRPLSSIVPAVAVVLVVVAFNVVGEHFGDRLAGSWSPATAPTTSPPCPTRSPRRRPLPTHPGWRTVDQRDGHAAPRERSAQDLPDGKS
ncbi:hypothetical protein [Streptomyces sp. DASNCL29]|uniref:hypothetical protein n=1 Tax=Streptomyces sp. DASNCL29 TaxID=2583819 RepID=UPI0019D264FA|nr:hypothetical protein [Streptomyces sp. DASNCL29]